MWQAYVFPTGPISLGSDTIVGKLRTSRKEARIEARRMAREFYTTNIKSDSAFYGEKAIAILPDTAPVHIHSPYGQLGWYGVRWQPEESPS